jgi:hypothetical protein
MNIYKELLSEVLGRKISKISEAYHEINHRVYIDFEYKSLDQGDGVNIDVHALAHKCKEWAKANGYAIWTTHEGHCKFGKEAQNIDKLHNLYGNVFSGCDGPISESDSVFKACQWILDNKD